MMKALDFAKLDGVDQQTNVAVAGKPGAVMLVASLVTATHAISDDTGVAADIENRWSGFLQLLRQVEIRRDIDPGQRLKVEFFDRELFLLQLAADDWLQVGALRHGP